MKKIIIIVIMLIVYALFSRNSYSVYNEKIVFDLGNKEIAISFIDDNILVSSKNGNEFLVLDDKKDYNLSKFNISSLNVILLEDISNLNLKYNSKYILSKSIKVNDVDYSISNNILNISYLDTVFCIYMNNYSVNSDTRQCNFIYLYNTENFNKIDVDDKVDIIFVNENATIPTYFLEDIYSKWIDVYTLNKGEVTIIKIGNGDYNMFVI